MRPVSEGSIGVNSTHRTTLTRIFSHTTEYGQNIDDFLDSLDAVGVDLSGTELEEHARSIQRSNRMLAILEGSLEILRRKPNDGEECYWVLYYTYICPQASSKTQEIVFKLSQHQIDVSVPTYYRRRQAAIDALSAILWGYTSRDTNEILNHYLRYERHAKRMSK